MTKRTIWLLFVFLMPVMVLAQKEITAATPWQQYLDQLSDVEDFEDQSWEEYEDVLNELAEHPHQHQYRHYGRPSAPAVSHRPADRGHRGLHLSLWGDEEPGRACHNKRHVVGSAPVVDVLCLCR